MKLEKKVIFKLFDLFEWINLHKKLNFVFTGILFSGIFLSSNTTTLQWQYWVMVFLCMLLYSKAYSDGRVDEQLFQKKMKKDIKTYTDEVIEEVSEEIIKKVFEKSGVKVTPTGRRID